MAGVLALEREGFALAQDVLDNPPTGGGSDGPYDFPSIPGQHRRPGHCGEDLTCNNLKCVNLTCLPETTIPWPPPSVRYRVSSCFPVMQRPGTYSSLSMTVMTHLAILQWLISLFMGIYFGVREVSTWTLTLAIVLPLASMEMSFMLYFAYNLFEGASRKWVFLLCVCLQMCVFLVWSSLISHLTSPVHSHRRRSYYLIAATVIALCIFIIAPLLAVLAVAWEYTATHILIGAVLSIVQLYVIWFNINVMFTSVSANAEALMLSPSIVPTIVYFAVSCCACVTETDRRSFLTFFSPSLSCFPSFPTTDKGYRRPARLPPPQVQEFPLSSE